MVVITAWVSSLQEEEEEADEWVGVRELSTKGGVKQAVLTTDLGENFEGGREGGREARSRH